MGIVLVSAVIALVAALLSGGRLVAVESVPVRVVALLGATLFCQIAGVLLGHLGLPAGPIYNVACLISAILLVVLLRTKDAPAGTELIAAGLFLIALVMAANGNMPVSEYAAERAGAPASVTTDARHEPATSATGLRFLGEVIPVPLPLRPEVDSVGELLIAAGLAQLVFGAVRPYGRRNPQAVRTGVKRRELSRTD